MRPAETTETIQSKIGLDRPSLTGDINSGLKFRGDLKALLKHGETTGCHPQNPASQNGPGQLVPRASGSSDGMIPAAIQVSDLLLFGNGCLSASGPKNSEAAWLSNQKHGCTFQRSNSCRQKPTRATGQCSTKSAGVLVNLSQNLTDPVSDSQIDTEN